MISPSSSEEHLSELLARPQSTPIALRSIDENCFITRRRHRQTLNSQCLFDLDDDRYCLRPPPLLVLSQSIQAKHPEQLNETKLNHRFSAKKDLPTSLANYSLVFYGFNPTLVFVSPVDLHVSLIVDNWPKVGDCRVEWAIVSHRKRSIC